jgi:hypothetical protein
MGSAGSHDDTKMMSSVDVATGTNWAFFGRT